VRRGYALAEVLVALALAGLLLAGTVQVYVAGMDHANRVGQALAARRGVDWALARLAADLELAGHLLPLPGRTLPEMPATLGWPGGWRLIPGGPDPTGPGRVPGWAELALVCDRPVPASLVLAEATTEGAGTVLVRAHRSLRLRAGDLLLAPGERLGWAAVAADADLLPGRTAAVALEPAPAASGWAQARPAGTPLDVLRPARLVRFAVVPLGPRNRPDPAGEPCLVRFEIPCPADGREPPWHRGWGRTGDAPGARIRREVLVRGVIGFQAAFTPAGERRPAGFTMGLAVAGSGRARAAGTLRLALRAGGP
jgi:prepilin-type N-terminal cleavage/methylation domain-containing protein